MRKDVLKNRGGNSFVKNVVIHPNFDRDFDSLILFEKIHDVKLVASPYEMYVHVVPSHYNLNDGEYFFTRGVREFLSRL